MYCPNCGKKVDEKAVVCVGCGVLLDNNASSAVATNNSPKRGKGIASMVLGIIAVLYSLLAFAAFDSLDQDLFGVTSSYQIGYAIGFVLVQSVLAIVSVSLACSERKREKNGFNTAGFWLSLVAFILIAISFIYVVTY